MRNFLFTASAALALALTAAPAESKITGGKCTSKQKGCSTEMFTNKAGESGYQCNCPDKRQERPRNQKQ